MDRLFELPRLYHNIDHPSYRPDETQFDPELTAEGSSITSPDPDVVEVDKGRVTEKEKKKKGKGKMKGVDPEVAEESAHEEEQATSQKGAGKLKGKGQKQQRIPVSFPTSDNEEEEGKRQSSDDRKVQEKGKKKQPADEEEDNDSPTSSSATRSRSSSIAGADPTSSPDPSQLRHLVVDHILESKSHLDFLHSLPEQRGPLLIRFPTTTFQKAWKKRYFTLHRDGLYFHEEQSFIHPNQGRGNGMGGARGGGGGAAWTGGVNYDKCKKIDISKFTVIQQAVSPADNSAISASAASPAATPGEKVYGGGQPIPSDSDRHESSTLDLRSGGLGGGKPPSKFDEMFKNKGHTPMKEKPEGHVVRGRRRSSVVLDKGCMIILLMPTDKKTDPVELTGLNEGGLADMQVLNEWVHALNARICLLSYLNSPLHLHSLGRGGREVLAFLTDPSAAVLRIAHKFTELAPVLAHFKEPLSQRNGPLSFIFNHCAFTDDALLALCDILLANPQLEVDLLSLSGNLLTARSMGALHRTLRTNLHIKQLILDQNQLGDAGLDVLLHGEAHTTAASKGEEEGEKSPSVWSEDMELHTISLKQNQLSDRGLEAFLHSILEAFSAVQKEEDKATEEDEEEASTPSSSAPSTSPPSSFNFSSLDFSCNQITDLGVQVLSGFLQRHPRVQQLNLSSCFVTDEGVAALTDALGAEGSTLRSLNLSHNQITSAGMSRLIDALTPQPHKRQMELELSGNTGIGAEGLQKLLSLRVPAKEGETDSSLWPVKLNSLSFTLFDETMMPAAVTAASTQSTAASTSSLAPSAPAAVQNVLNLFSPSEDASQLPPLPNFHSATPVDASQTPLPTGHESPAKVVPAPQTANAGGSPASATLSPSSPALPLSPAPPSASTSLSASTSTSQPKQLGTKGRRPSFNDPSAPRITISNVDRQRPTGKLTIPQLQPPPQFMPPTPSPEPEPDHPQAETQGAEEKQEAITQPAPAAHADEEEDDPNKQELIPTPPGWRKPPGVAI